MSLHHRPHGRSSGVNEMTAGALLSGWVWKTPRDLDYSVREFTILTSSGYVYPLRSDEDSSEGLIV